MKSTLIAAILTLFFITATPMAGTADWVHISNRTLLSLSLLISHIPQLDNSTIQGECTAFSISPSRHLYLTAAHCAGQAMTVGGADAGVIFMDDRLDVMVLQVPGLDKPMLLPAKGTVRVGQEVAAFGYGYGWVQPTIKVGLVGIPDIQLHEMGNRHLTITNFAFITGMSGGPIVDVEGKVVSIVQQGNRDGQAGMGATLKVLLGAVGGYWSP